MIRTTDLRKLIHEHNGNMCDVYESLMDDYDWIDATICGLDAGWAIAFGSELINDMEIAKKRTLIFHLMKTMRIIHLIQNSNLFKSRKNSVH